MRRVPLRHSTCARALAEPPSAIKAIALKPGPVRSSSGVEMPARKPNPAAVDITTLIVSGGNGVRGVWMPVLRRRPCAAWPSQACASPASAPAPTSWLKPACSTASALPHIGSARSISSRPIPRIKLEPDQIFVCDGGIWTWEGITRRHRHVAGDDRGGLRRGGRAANRAGELVLYHRRSGGQSAAILLAPGTESADRTLCAAAWPGRGKSRCAADRRGRGRARLA